MRRTWLAVVGLLAAALAVPAHARLVEAEASAIVENGAHGAARELAIQRAIREALLQTVVYVDSSELVSENVLVAESARVSAAGVVKDVIVLDEWTLGNVLHVRIRADVVENRLRAPSPAARYRKKIAVVQFQVADRVQIADLPSVERDLPRELLRRLELAGAVLPLDATQYAIEGWADGVDGSDRREVITKLAEQLDAQFILAGTIRDMGQSRRLLQNTRRIELDVVVLDGLSGAVVTRQRVNDYARGMHSLTADSAFDSAAFLRTPYGRVVDRAIDRVAQHLGRELAELPFAARVVNGEGRKIYFNAGATSSVQVGDVLMTYRLAPETLRYPRNQDFLGYPETPAATLVVKQVQPLFAVGELETGALSLKTGDIVRFAW